MITDVHRGKSVRSGDFCPWTVGLLLCVVTAAGCAGLVSIDYQATNPLRGQGRVGTAPFRYHASDEHRVRPRQVETNPSAKTDLFLSQEIGVFFSDALRLELGRSGYQLDDVSALIISGSITRFYLDWTSGVDRSFELAVVYTVRSGERTLFSWPCSSVQKGPNILVQNGILIRKGTADCMGRFIEAAQNERVF
jgi:hypothetical protein